MHTEKTGQTKDSEAKAPTILVSLGLWGETSRIHNPNNPSSFTSLILDIIGISFRKVGGGVLLAGTNGTAMEADPGHYEVSYGPMGTIEFTIV